MKKLPLIILAVCVMAFLTMGADAGKTYKPNDEGFIVNWLVLDPIKLPEAAATHEEDSQKEFLNKEFFKGQKEATPKDGDKVTVDGKERAWHARPTDDDALSFEDFADDITNSLFMGVAYIICDNDMPDVKLAIGSDDSSMWMLNGKEVIRVYEGRAVDKDQNTSPALSLRKGMNVLCFAVINGDGPAGACARFVDKDGNPIKSFTVSLTPPEK